MTTEVKIGDNTYRINTLNTFDQWHVAGAFSLVLMQLSSLTKPDTMRQEESFARIFASCASAMPTEGVDAAIKLCLASVQRKLPGDTGWAPMVTSGKLMYEDVGVKGMLALVWHTILANGLVDFFSAPPSSSAGGIPA